MTFQKNQIILLIYFGFLISALNCHKESKESHLANHRRSSLFDYFMQLFDSFVRTEVAKQCESHLNDNKYNAENRTWTCDLLMVNQASDDQILNCICSYEYDCEDHEDFYLESEYDDGLDELTSDPYGFSKAEEECEEKLNDLTEETTWKCVYSNTLESNYDFRIHCECSRFFKCKFNKILKFNDSL
jgi:hypothetical protein